MSERMDNNVQPAPQETQELSVEEAFAQIRDLLAEMESEEVSLEKSFENYEKGMKLIRQCNEKIDRLEQKVQKMNADGSLEDFA